VTQITKRGKVSPTSFWTPQNHVDIGRNSYARLLFQKVFCFKILLAYWQSVKLLLVTLIQGAYGPILKEEPFLIES